MKPNLLFISAHLPSLRVPQAGHKIAYNNLVRYSKDFNVYLISFVNSIEKKYYKEEDYNFCTKTTFFTLNNFQRVISLLNNLKIPLHMAIRKRNTVSNLIKGLQQKEKFELVHFEFTSSLVYISDISSEINISVIEHDVTYQAIQRKQEYYKNYFLKHLYRLAYYKQKKWELKALKETNKIYVLNTKDKQILIDDGISESKISVIEPEIDERIKNINRSCYDKDTILFWGAMNRPENIDAVFWFKDHILPNIEKKVPRIKFYIVGANPPEKLRNICSSQIIVTGFVESPVTYFEKCHVAIAPLRLGAGIKIKVLEYLEAGLPVVSTSVGAEGISHSNLYVSDDPKVFADLLIKILEKG